MSTLSVRMCPLMESPLMQHVLDDQLRFAAVLQNQRIERQESLREHYPARRRSDDSGCRHRQFTAALSSRTTVVSPHVRDVAGEIRLHSALTQQRRAEVAPRSATPVSPTP